MSLFIGHKTAELLLDSPGAASFTPADDVALEHCWASRSDLSAIDLSELMDVPTPYDVLISRREEKRFWRGVRCHVCANDLPLGSFLQVAPDVYVASPALCFVQMAQTLSLCQTIALGSRFCGTYALDDTKGSGIRRRPPLLDIEGLQGYVESCGNIRGVKRARRAAQLILSGSASPMETITVMVFSFPTRLGGLGLPNPTMNYEKTLTPLAGRVCGKSLIRIDAFWENYDFGLEYQGKYGHSSHTKIAADIGRQLAAECMGIELQMLTIEQIRDFEQRMLIARKIASRVGRRLPTDPGVLSANQRLVDDLLVF